MGRGMDRHGRKELKKEVGFAAGPMGSAAMSRRLAGAPRELNGGSAPVSQCCLIDMDFSAMPEGRFAKFDRTRQWLFAGAFLACAPATGTAAEYEVDGVV